MAVDADGNTFGMPVMDNFKKLQTMFDEMKTWVGKEATFTYFERTKANSYRHPLFKACLLYTSPSPRDLSTSRMPSSA